MANSFSFKKQYLNDTVFLISFCTVCLLYFLSSNKGLTRSYIGDLDDGSIVSFVDNDNLKVTITNAVISLSPTSKDELPSVQQVLNKVFNGRDLEARTGLLDGENSEVTIRDV